MVMGGARFGTQMRVHGATETFAIDGYGMVMKDGLRDRPERGSGRPTTPVV
jgi:hypothetical protein